MKGNNAGQYSDMSLYLRVPTPTMHKEVNCQGCSDRNMYYPRDIFISHERSHSSHRILICRPGLRECCS